MAWKQQFRPPEAAAQGRLVIADLSAAGGHAQMQPARQRGPATRKSFPNTAF